MPLFNIMQIFVKYNTTYTFDITNKTTVEELKNMISQKINIPKHYFYLTYSSKVLYNTLSQYNISECSQLWLMLRN